MQQLVFHSPVHPQREGQPALWPGEAAGTLDYLPADGIQTFEGQNRGSLLRGLERFVGGDQLHLPVQVMRHDRCQHVGLVSGERSCRHIIQVPLGLQLGKHAFLGAAAVVEGNDLAGADFLVGHHHLEVVPVFVGDEEVELDRLLVLDPCLAANEDEAEAALPFLRLPALLEERDLPIEAAPDLSLLHHPLELDQTLEGNADGELDAKKLEQADHVVAEEGTIHPDFDDHTRHLLLYQLDTVTNEVQRSSGVMDVSRAMKEVEDLAELGDSAEQRVIAALALLLLVVTNGSAFSFPASADHRPIEVEGDPAQAEDFQSTDHQIPHGFTKPEHAQFVSCRQCPADGGHIGQLRQAEHAEYQGIVPIVTNLPQTPVAQQQVNDEQEIQPGVVKDIADLDVPVAPAKPLLQAEVIDQGLEEDQAGEGGQPLAFEPESGTFSGGFVHLFSARLGHEKRSPWVSNCWFLVEPILTYLVAAFLFSGLFLYLTRGGL